MDFLVRLVNSVLHLPNEQAMFPGKILEETQITEVLEETDLGEGGWRGGGLVKMFLRLVVTRAVIKV